MSFLGGGLPHHNLSLSHCWASSQRGYICAATADMMKSLTTRTSDFSVLGVSIEQAGVWLNLEAADGWSFVCWLCASEAVSAARSGN
jgi:hypothetical protein